MRRTLVSVLKWAGKGDGKVAAVFGSAPAACHSAVVHLRSGAPEVPVWLFATMRPSPETVQLCERVHVHPHSLILLFQAQALLWRRWVAISVGTWTGGRGQWPLKLAPFLIPPCRALLMNGQGGFFSGTPANVLCHCRRGIFDAVHSGWNRMRDLGRGVRCSGPATRLKDVSCGLSSLIASTLLRWCSYADRRLFHWLRGDTRLTVLSTPFGGDGLVRFKQRRERWNGPELERLVHASDARWILFQEEGIDQPVDDLLPLLASRRTFAVSRQAGFREWKPMLFAMAPFRTLQPGEASQVMAPISETILVDRKKLAALGIPRCSLAGTAWMLLFWKAAAAGWRSYSVGGGGAAHQQPDFPVQERVFIFRALRDPALRRLGPSEPDLARGCIAFSAGAHTAARPLADRLKVLVVSPFLPYPLSHGGVVRIYNLCRALANRVDFILVALRETRDVVDYGKLHEIFREVYVVDRDEPAAKDGRLPQQVREHRSRSLRALIAELCRTSKPDLLQIEYTHMAAFRDSAPEVRAILVEHDLTFALYRQLAQNAPGKAARREYRRWLAFERQWLHAYDAVWTMSEEDRQTAIREGGRRPDRTFAIPNGVDIGRFAPREAPASPPEVFYVGSFRHLPNVLGFENLLRKVMPLVWRSLPNVRLRVVAGPEHERFWRQREGLDDRIEIHGFVEDLRPLYARASVVVVPLQVSAGTNIKVLEAMACAKAIVTTPVGCAGLGLQDGSDAIIRENWADFAFSVRALLADAVLRSRLAAQARRTAEERFSWTEVAECVYQNYAALAARWEQGRIRSA